MSKYDDCLRRLKDDHRITVSAATSNLYKCLKLEEPEMSKDDMYDRIMKDCLSIGWQKGSIQNNMPDELKDEERQKSGKKGREKQLIPVTTDGSVAQEVIGYDNNKDKETIAILEEKLRKAERLEKELRTA